MTQPPNRRTYAVRSEFTRLFLFTALLGGYGLFACIQLWRTGHRAIDSEFYAVTYAWMVLLYSVVTITILLRLRRKLKAILPAESYDGTK
jgi:hypothetical protein